MTFCCQGDTMMGFLQRGTIFQYFSSLLTNSTRFLITACSVFLMFIRLDRNPALRGSSVQQRQFMAQDLRTESLSQILQPTYRKKIKKHVMQVASTVTQG